VRLIFVTIGRKYFHTYTSTV